MNEQRPEAKIKEKAVNEFKDKLFAKLGKASLKATQDYQQRIKHTGGYLGQSMVIAYSAGVNNMLNILLKEMTNVEEDKTEQASSNTGS